MLKFGQCEMFVPGCW